MSGTVPTWARVESIMSRMPSYTFEICQGGRSQRSVSSDCSDHNAAQVEAAGMFVDMARDIADELPSNPEWKIEVADEAGEMFFRLSILAESMK
jgi:hypothetical protein